MTVFAQTRTRAEPGFIGAFIVETGWEGVRIGKEMPKMGLGQARPPPSSSRTCAYPKKISSADPERVSKVAMTVLNYGRLGLGASSASLMNISARDMFETGFIQDSIPGPDQSFRLVQEKIVRARVSEAVSSAMNPLVGRDFQDRPLFPTAS